MPIPPSYRRIAWLALLFIAELVFITVRLDAGSLSRGNLVTFWMQREGVMALRALVAFTGLFLVLGYLQAKPALLRIGEEALHIPIDWRFLAGHVCAISLLAGLSPLLFGGTSQGSQTGAIGALWMVAGLLAIVLAALAFIAPALWRQLFRATGKVWIFALLAALVASWFAGIVRLLWAPTTRLTFSIVKVMLRPFLSSVISDPVAMRIGSPHFHVLITPDCSGLEGVGLMLVFAVAWLWLFRHELNFPQAFFLVPVGLLAAFLLNSVRIATLILIGNAGAPGVAIGGFHSQAGWIAFNVVALGLTLGAQHVPGVAKRRSSKPRPDGAPEDLTAAYLLPFLAILAAAMLSRAASARFEWLYPLRLFAAAAVLWWNRKHYRSLNWRFGWLAAVAGAAIFALWIALDRLAPSPATAGTVGGLTAGHGPAWVIWLVLRTLGAVVTVPIAEELAFRGYLLRRLVSADFERVDFRAASLFALLVSSLAFGLMHGGRWIAGAVAGLVYALVLRRRGRIGDAVAAHACTNALLAVWVITRGEWNLW